MKIEPSGVIFTGACSIQTDRCRARESGTVSAVWASPGRLQIDVCAACLDEQMRSGDWEIQGAKIKGEPDVTVYSPNGKRQLVVEVQTNPSCRKPALEWAKKMRHNLLAHAGIPVSPYFMLALIPDYLYLWKESYPVDPDRAPDYEIPLPEVLQPYLAHLALPPFRVGDKQMGEIIAAWLKEITAAQPSADASLQWLYDSGLYEALKDGSVEMQEKLAA
jgi:hypothetical protein